MVTISICDLNKKDRLLLQRSIIQEAKPWQLKEWMRWMIMPALPKESPPWVTAAWEALESQPARPPLLGLCRV